MTVATAYAPLSFAGNGVTVALPVTWPFFTGSLVVTHTSALGVETVYSTPTHYSVSGGTDANGLPATGTVTLVSAHATGTTITVTRVTPRTQAATWSENDNFPEKVVEASFDKALLIGQEAIYLAENPDLVDVSIAIGTVTTGAAGSSASASVTEGGEGEFTLNLTIPRGDTGASGVGSGDVVGPASATADALALFNGTTGKIIKDSTYTITAAGAALIDDASASAQRTTLGLGSVATQGDGDKGDITVSASGATWTIDNDAVTYAKMQNASATSRILARKTAGAGDFEESTLSEVLDFVGSAAQGDILYRGGSGWVRLGAGTSGQFLQTSGGGANPIWADTSGIWVEIGDTTIGAPVATVEHTFTAGTYSAIRVMLSDLSGSAASTTLQVDLRHSGGSVLLLQHGAASIVASDITTGSVDVAIGTDASTKHHVGSILVYTTSLGSSITVYAGSNATAPDRIRVSYSSGNIDDGRIITYGLKV